MGRSAGVHLRALRVSAAIGTREHDRVHREARFLWLRAAETEGRTEAAKGKEWVADSLRLGGRPWHRRLHSGYARRHGRENRRCDYITRGTHEHDRLWVYSHLTVELSWNSDTGTHAIGYQQCRQCVRSDDDRFFLIGIEECDPALLHVERDVAWSAGRQPYRLRHPC